MCDSACDCDQPNQGESTKSDKQDRKCRRCNSEPFVLLDKVHAECKSCFLESCNKKLRSTIGKSKLLKNNDPILIAYSGGASSSALLDLIKNSMIYEARREQKFRPSILHVDANFQANPKERLEKLGFILSSAARLYPSWPIYWTVLEMSSSQPNCDSTPLYVKYNPDHNLANIELGSVIANYPAVHQTFLNALETFDLTDHQQHVYSCLMDLLGRVAEQINASHESKSDDFNYIFTGSSATQLANNLLVDVILGQGSSIRSAVSVCDRRLVVPILRPMRDFSKKEIAFYLKAMDIEFHVETDSATFADKKASIQKLTESFLSKLSVDYPSTYSTLLRTGNKMQQ